MNPTSLGLRYRLVYFGAAPLVYCNFNDGEWTVLEAVSPARLIEGEDGLPACARYRGLKIRLTITTASQASSL